MRDHGSIRRRLLLTLILLGATAACQPETPLPFKGEREPWAGDDPQDWPCIAMVNRIRYSDSNHPMAGSAFLLDTGEQLVAVTAKHVLRYFKSEAMDSVDFRDTLVSWEMFPKDSPGDVIVVGALINEDAGEPLDAIRAENDWLFFAVESGFERVQTLRLRTTPLETGEAVFVVGWRYTDEGRQHVYRGRYVRSENGSVLIDSPDLTHNKVPGLSGAPVIDAGGRVIGIMSAKSGKLQRLGSIDYPMRMLE